MNSWLNLGSYSSRAREMVFAVANVWNIEREGLSPVRIDLSSDALRAIAARVPGVRRVGTIKTRELRKGYTGETNNLLEFSLFM